MKLYVNEIIEVMSRHVTDIRNFKLEKSTACGLNEKVCLDLHIKPSIKNKTRIHTMFFRKPEHLENLKMLVEKKNCRAEHLKNIIPKQEIQTMEEETSNFLQINICGSPIEEEQSMSSPDVYIREDLQRLNAIETNSKMKPSSFAISKREMYAMEDDDSEFLQLLNTNNNLKEEQPVSSRDVFPTDNAGLYKSFKKVNWISSGIDITCTESEWKIMFRDNAPQKNCYTKIITRKMEKKFPCVLTSKGYYMTKNVCALRFQCVFPTCRKYKLIRYYSNKIPFQFSVFYDRNAIDHPSEVRATKYFRKSLRPSLIKFYRDNCHGSKITEPSMNPSLSVNSQQIKSTEISRKISPVAFSMDFHKADIEELNLLMIQQGREDKKNQYLQYIINNPFGVYAFSPSQLEIVRHCSRFQELTVHIDATSSLIRQPSGLSESIFYYVCSIPLHSFLLSEQCAEFPICEMINSSCDTFAIKTWLSHFKFSFVKSHDSWPCFQHIVSDFNYCILNAISESLNNCKLINYLQLAYYSIVKQMPFSLINVHLCCDHLMTSMIKDVKKSYEQLERADIKFIISVLSSLYIICNIERMDYIWRRLSVLLMAKCCTTYVEACRTELEEVILNEEEHETEDTEQFYANETVISQEEGLDYSSSPFFQHFSQISNEYDSNSDIKDHFAVEGVNPFCNHHLLDILLKKYMSILPLWTSVLLEMPMKFSNENVGNYFGQIRERCKRKCHEIGEPPYNCSRFLKETRAYINEAEKQFCYIPKTQLSRKMELPRSEENVISVSLEQKNGANAIDAATLSVVKSLLIQCGMQKRPLNEEMSNDDTSPTAAEDECQKRKYVTSTYFCRDKIASIIEMHALHLITGKTVIESGTGFENDMKNGLKHDVHFYLRPILQSGSYTEQCNYVVSRRGHLTLFLEDYYSLYGKQNLTSLIVEYILATLILGKEEFEIISSEISTAIFSDKYPQYVSTFKVNNETKMLFLPVNEQRRYWVLLILDLENKIFYCCDSTSLVESATYFKTFLETDFGETPIGPTNAWKLGTYKHDHEQDLYNSGVCLLHYAEQIISSGHTASSNGLFDPDIYRFILLEYVLQTSDNMRSNCLICGSLHYHKCQTVHWIQCEKCNRWLHISCLNKKDSTTWNLSDYEHKQFLCFLCL